MMMILLACFQDKESINNKSKNSMPNEVNDDDENIFNENNVETDSYIDKKEQKAQRKRRKSGITC